MHRQPQIMAKGTRKNRRSRRARRKTDVRQLNSQGWVSWPAPGRVTATGLTACSTFENHGLQGHLAGSFPSLIPGVQGGGKPPFEARKALFSDIYLSQSEA